MEDILTQLLKQNEEIRKTILLLSNENSKQYKETNTLNSLDFQRDSSTMRQTRSYNPFMGTQVSTNIVDSMSNQSDKDEYELTDTQDSDYRYHKRYRKTQRTRRRRNHKKQKLQPIRQEMILRNGTKLNHSENQFTILKEEAFDGQQPDWHISNSDQIVDDFSIDLGDLSIRNISPKLEVGNYDGVKTESIHAPEIESEQHQQFKIQAPKIEVDRNPQPSLTIIKLKQTSMQLSNLTRNKQEPFITIEKPDDFKASQYLCQEEQNHQPQSNYYLKLGRRGRPRRTSRVQIPCDECSKLFKSQNNLEKHKIVTHRIQLILF